MRPRALAICLLAATATLPACSKDPQVAKMEYLRSGDEFVAQKKYPEAILQYKNALNQDPEFGEAKAKLAQAYLDNGDMPNAFREFIRAADLLPNDAQAQLRAGELLLATQNFEDARTRAEKALAVDSGLIEAQILRANALAGLGKLDDAVTEIEEAIRQAPERSASYASLGLVKLVKGDKAAAEAAFKRAVDADPKSLTARLALANFYWSTNQRPEAERELKAALDIDSRHVLANRAMALFQIGSGRGAAAEPFLKVAAEETPNASGRLMLADYYVALNRRDEARRIWEEVASAPDGFATAKLRLAGLAAASRDLPAALALVDEILAKDTSNVDALTARAQVLTDMARLDDALAAARSATAAQPQSAKAHYMLGRVLAHQRDETGALGAFNDALRLNPRFAQAEVELAKLHFAAGRLDQAEQFANSALGAVAGYADAHLLLARIHLARGQAARAEPSLRALATSFPDAPNVQAQVGLLEIQKKNRPAARAAFSRALAGNPLHPEALAGLVQLDLEDRNVAAARARVDDAIKRAPGTPLLLLLAGRTYRATGDSVTAERLVREAIDADPNNLDGYSTLGSFYAVDRRIPEAIAQFEKVASLRPKAIGVHTTLAMLFEIQNNIDQAQAKYEEVLRIDPRAAVASNNLAWIYATRGGNLDVALRLAQTAKSQLPDRHEVNDTLGWVYYKKGLSEMAVPALRSAVVQDPRNATYHYHLGMAYAAVGQPARARVALERALELNSEFDGAAEARRTLESLKS